MKLLFVGAGGVGGYFGGRLAQIGADVTFLVRPARASLLAERGLIIRSPRGDAHMTVRTVTASAPGSGYDLIIVSPKAYDLPSCIDSFSAAVTRSTAIMPLLNGLGHMDVLDARFGRERIVGGVAAIAAQLNDDGSIGHLNQFHSITAGGRCDRTQSIARAFVHLASSANMDAQVSADIEQALWEKWVFLASLAAGTTLFDGSIGEIVASPLGEDLMRTLFAEALQTAQASGHEIGLEPRERGLGQLTQVGSGFTASMYRDLRAGLRTEHEHILGDLVERAIRARVPAPLLRAALTHLRVVQNRLTAPPRDH